MKTPTMKSNPQINATPKNTTTDVIPISTSAVKKSLIISSIHMWNSVTVVLSSSVSRRIEASGGQEPRFDSSVLTSCLVAVVARWSACAVPSCLVASCNCCRSVGFTAGTALFPQAFFSDDFSFSSHLISSACNQNTSCQLNSLF